MGIELKKVAGIRGRVYVASKSIHGYVEKRMFPYTPKGKIDALTYLDGKVTSHRKRIVQTFVKVFNNKGYIRGVHFVVRRRVRITDSVDLVMKRSVRGERIYRSTKVRCLADLYGILDEYMAVIEEMAKDSLYNFAYAQEIKDKKVIAKDLYRQQYLDIVAEIDDGNNRG